MPIRASERARYPADWKTISLAIRKRAGQRCECVGLCGEGEHDGRCNAPNGEVIIRLERGIWRSHEHTGACMVERCDSWGGRSVLVILTVAHLNHAPEDCRPENLRALCQRCHLRYDRPHHGATARATRAARRGLRLPGI
jgi:hypothetical protein